MDYIDWIHKQISIIKQTNSIKNNQKTYEITPPKTQKNNKILPLPNVLYNDLIKLHNKKNTMSSIKVSLYLKNWILLNDIKNAMDNLNLTLDKH